MAAAAAVDVTVAAGGAPVKRVQLLPLGEVAMRDGRGPYRLDPADAPAVIEATRRYLGRTAMMVDYDHQHHFGVKEGVAATAPAAGWIDTATLEVGTDGIYGLVEWTEAAAAKLAAREYRYLSPLFAYDQGTRRVTALLAAGLTNVPAIEALAAAASAQPQKDPASMDYSQIATALGLAEGATLDDILAKIAGMTEVAAAAATTSTAIAAAAARLGLAATANVDELVAAARAKVDPAKFVPAAAVAELQAEMAAVRKERAESAVAAAVEAGKVAPALKDWAIDFASTNRPGFDAWLAAAPVILDPAAVVTAAAVTPGGDGLTESERSTAKMLGLTPEKFLAAKKGA